MHCPSAAAHPQAFLLAATKAAWYLYCLPRSPAKDPRLALTAVQSAVSYMVTLVGARTTHLAELRFGPGCRCGVPPCHIRCLGVIRALPYRDASWEDTCLTVCVLSFGPWSWPQEPSQRLVLQDSLRVW